MKLCVYPNESVTVMKGFFQKYLDNHCTEEEFRSVVELFVKEDNRQMLEENMKENWETNTSGAIPDLSDTLYKIHYEINRQEQVQSKSRKLLTYMTRIAAILLVPLAIAYVYQLHKNIHDREILQTVSTPLASKTSFKLPDGSTVWLNSGSSISFSKNFEGGARLVRLTGEAYFDVRKGKQPFLVETPIFTVNVVGTAFNVMAYEHEMPAVTLERGKVLVETRSNGCKTLTPGQQAVIDTLNQSITLKDVEPNLYSSWINNRLIFKNEPLRTVVKRLERWYNIDISIADQSLQDISMTATIELESVAEVMELMELTLPVSHKYKKDDRQLIIFKN